MKLEILEPHDSPSGPRARSEAGDAASTAPCCARHEPGSLGWVCPEHAASLSARPGICAVCGLPLEPVGGSGDRRTGRGTRDRIDAWRLPLVALAGLTVMAIGMGSMAGGSHGGGHPGLGLLEMTLATLVVFWGGRPILEGGIAGFRRGRPTMFSLVTLGVLAAWGHGVAGRLAPQRFPAAFRDASGEVPAFFESAAMIVVLVLVGQWLESRARRRTTGAIRSLLGLAPATAVLLEADPSGRDASAGAAIGVTAAPGPTGTRRQREVPLAAVRPGDRLLVTPGGRVPVDGRVLAGEGACDESLLTGEPGPVAKRPGDRVLGGSINASTTLEIEATLAAADSLVARITRLVREAHARRAPIERLADRVSAWFVPAVVVVAAATFLLWTFFGPRPAMAHGLAAAVSVLVIACPCALGLATPLAMTVAVGRATREGILFRSAAAVETLSTCDAVAFDKTGTLTVGFPRIVESGLMPGCEQRGIGGAADLVRLVAAVESAAGHAIGRAFAVAAGAQARPIGAVETSLPPAQDVVLTPGRGAAGRVAGRSVLVGSRAFLAERGVPLDCDGLRPVEEALARAGSEGRTLVLVAVDGHAAGWFGLEDAARAEAASVVRQLQSMGLAVSMLSGDTPEAAARIGLAAGIRDARGGLLPAEKLALIEAWQREGRRVAFVGDGVNDAPALAAAATGVAMGTGADVAIETADVTLLARGLEPLPTAVTLARRTMVVVRQNLWLAVVYNVLAIPVAAGLLSSLVGPAMGPMAAAAAMAASSLSVIANSLRLERGIDRQPPSAQGSYNAPGSGTTRPS